MQWSEMREKGCGRFCDTCNKTVIDFTSWSDARIYNHLKKNAHVCGRLTATQLNREIMPPPSPSRPIYRMAVALGIALLASGSVTAQSFSRPPIVYNTDSAAQLQQKKSNPDSVTIRGTITDKMKQPLTNASITLKRNGKLIAGATSDLDGNYEFRNLPPGEYDATANFTGFSPQTITSIKSDEPTTITVDFALSSDGHTLEVITVGRIAPFTDKYNSGKTTFRKDRINAFGN